MRDTWDPGMCGEPRSTDYVDLAKTGRRNILEGIYEIKVTKTERV